MVHSAAVRSAIFAVTCTFGFAGATTAFASVEDERQEVLSAAAVSLSQAMEKAQSEYNGFAIEGALLEKEGMYFYQIDVITESGGTEVFINPANGLVIGADEGKRKNLFSTPRDNTLILTLKDAPISLKKAVSIALQHFSGTVFDLGLEEQMGRSIFDIRLNDESGRAAYEINFFHGSEESDISVALDNGDVLDGEIVVTSEKKDFSPTQ